MNIKIRLLLISSLFLASCTKVYDTPYVCFQEDILPIFVSNCSQSGCHNPIDQEEDLDLTHYDGIMKEVTPGHPALSEIYSVIKGKHPSITPEGRPALTDEQVNQIKLWIIIGAPNSSLCRECDTLNFTYSGRVQPILDNWCYGCHNSVAAEAGIDLTTYNGVVQVVNDGSLLGSIHHQAGFVPMPINTGGLSTCDISAIEHWINDGFPNN